jgi:hypothetical protein
MSRASAVARQQLARAGRANARELLFGSSSNDSRLEETYEARGAPTDPCDLEKIERAENIVDPARVYPGARSDQERLDLEQIAKVEVTSEHPNFPIESALTSAQGPGWRAAKRGKQIIRIISDEPRPLRRVTLEFSETQVERTQEFTLGWSTEPGGPVREIVRQQWSFSPHGSTSEVEDYRVDLDSVSVLELALKADLTPDNAFATLAKWRSSPRVPH